MDLQELLDNARRNETLLRRLQTLELQLLSCQGWAELLTLLCVDIPKQYALSSLTLCLFDPKERFRVSILRSLPTEQAHLISTLEFYRECASHPSVQYLNQDAMSALSLPLYRQQECLGYVRLEADDAGRFSQGMATDFLQHTASVIAACLVLVYQQEEQARLAITDPLTGVENRRGLELSFSQLWEQGLREQRPLSLMMLDLDYFKRINDEYGHAVGDYALQALCRTVRQVIRPYDHIGRIGGEEFVLLLPGCGAQQMDELANRIQQSVRLMPLPIQDKNCVGVTASGSYMTVLPDAVQAFTLNQLLDHLDGYLYQAKDRGRDCFMNANINEHY